MGASALDEEAQAKILRQVEFYFSDSNLPGDKFLLKCIEEAEDGLISLPLICSFSRMRSHLGLKEHGADTVPAEITSAVADVLRKSSTLRLSEDGAKVGRVEKLKAPTEVQAEVDARSLAINPFPWNVTLDEVELFFKDHCKVNSVRLPRLAGAKSFSGYAVVEFASEEEAERVKGLKLSFQGAELESISKKAFEELQEINAQKAKQSNGKGRHDTGRVDEDEDDYPKGTVVSLTLTKLVKAGEESTDDAKVETNKEAGEEETKDAAVDTEMQVSREDIKETLKNYGKINFVDFSRGDKAGFVRFDLPEESQKARAAAVLASDGGFVIKEHLVVLNAVEGEAEKDYWKKLREGQGKRREGGGRGGFGDRGGRGGRGGKFGRGRGGGRRDGRRDRDERGEGRGSKHKRFEENEEGGERKAARTD
ncbi:lupus La protein [Marchantia polymorpha subsp. ruderalis]|uniref:HTH La-type RNA-binding domain-containing protein n=2 Tax=Marchantia polymorpha TaxID=3197 RepID=A0AAF6ALK2_MARPO|nr:hypothetical protein MARPO_0005s0125 [Marchantia polymorpha]BBM97322.1 hypothetical protein Mp_1g04820 [Marchantia polymorpha subsp. ruderalis]|eukprot:PTQ48484.1 hypothetical protein MARPO_0005s0125 [Marchantia polymorpha]